PAPERKASVPVRKPAAKPAAPATPTTPSTLTLAAGTKLSLSVTHTISTRSAKPGDGFTATGREDVRDASGRVVIPGGPSVAGPTAARASRDIDVVLPKGAGITIRLTRPLAVRRAT